MISVLNSSLKSLFWWPDQEKVIQVGLFKKKTIVKTYDKENKKPIIKASICNGEQVVGFKDIRTGRIEEIMLIKKPADLEDFKKMYGVVGDIEKQYWLYEYLCYWTFCPDRKKIIILLKYLDCDMLFLNIYHENFKGSEN